MGTGHNPPGHNPPCPYFKNTLKQLLIRYLLDIYYIFHTSIFAFVLWFYVFCVSILAHFQTAIIVCWGG